MAEDQGGPAIQRQRPAVDHVDRTLRIGMLVVQRGRNQPVLKRQHAQRRLQRPGRRPEIAEIALRRRHRHVAQHVADGLGFDAVVVDRAQAVGDDESRFGRLQSGRRQARRRWRGGWPCPGRAAHCGAARSALAQPSTRARIFAPRAWACRRVSRMNAAAPSPLTRPSRRASNGREAAAGSPLALRLPEHLAPHPEHRMEPRADPAGDDRVGLPSLQHADRLGQRRKPRHVAQGDGVVRPAGVLGDADVAGRHVGQILQHPQREQLGHNRRAPAAEIEPAVDHATADTCRPTRPVRRESCRPQASRPAARDRRAFRASRRRRTPGRPPRSPIGCRGSSPSGSSAAGRTASGRSRPPRRRSAAAVPGRRTAAARRMPLRPSHSAAQNGSLPMPIGLTMPTPVITMSELNAMPCQRRGKTNCPNFPS